MSSKRIVAGLLLILPALPAGCNPAARQEAAIAKYVDAQVLMASNDDQAALTALYAAIRQDPELSVAHAAVGDIHRRRGELKQAVQAYETACRTDPYAFRPRYNLGVTYQMLAEAAKTADTIQRYIRQAIQEYLQALQLKDEDYDSNLNLAACYFQLNKLEEAEQYARRAVELGPKSAEAYSNLGIILDSQGRLPEAVKAYEASLELDPNQAEVLMNIGSTYLRQGRLEAAMQEFHQAASVDEAQAGPWELIGATCFYMRDFPQAEQAYAKAIALDSQRASAHCGLGVIYMSRYILGGRSDETLRTQALDAWNASLELDPNQPELTDLVHKYTPNAQDGSDIHVVEAP